MDHPGTKTVKLRSKKIKIWDLPPARLDLLKIDHYFPDLTYQLIGNLRSSNCLTEKGFTGERLNGLGILQVCLLKSEPFDFQGALSERTHMIQDLRNGQKHSCQDRSKLLESLAEGLASFQGKYYIVHNNIDERLKDIKNSIKYIGRILDQYFILRSQGIITSEPIVKHLHQKTVNEGYTMIAEVINSITGEDYEKIVAHSEQRFSASTVELELIAYMRKSFEDYAPRRYSNEAIFHAIAAILLKFMIEDGDRSTVVSRIRKRLQRASA